MGKHFVRNADALKRMSAAIGASACSLMLAGCIAPLAVAAASGAGMFGSYKGMSAMQRHQLANDDRLRSVSAGNLGGSANDISISDKHWRHGVLEWVATNRNGQRFRCEMGEANMSCSPLVS